MADCGTARVNTVHVWAGSGGTGLLEGEDAG